MSGHQNQRPSNAAVAGTTVTTLPVPPRVRMMAAMTTPLSSARIEAAVDGDIKLPKDPPRENTTLPTITIEAIRLRVNTTMIMKIRQSEAIPAISMSYGEPSARSLNVAAVPPSAIWASSSGMPLTASIGSARPARG